MLIAALMESNRPRPTEWWVHQGAGRPAEAADVAAWAAVLLQGAAHMEETCPRCGHRGSVRVVLEHLLSVCGAGYAEAAVWLESVDRDLFAVPVHYLAAEARSGSAVRAPSA